MRRLAAVLLLCFVLPIAGQEKPLVIDLDEIPAPGDKDAATKYARLKERYDGKMVSASGRLRIAGGEGRTLWMAVTKDVKRGDLSFQVRIGAKFFDGPRKMLTEAAGAPKTATITGRAVVGGTGLTGTLITIEEDVKVSNIRPLK